MPADATAQSSTRPRLLIVGFGPYAQAPDNPAGLAADRLRAEGWSPAGLDLTACSIPVSWTRSPAEALAAAEAFRADAVLLLAATHQGTDFRVEMRAQNRASRRRTDADGLTWSEERILRTAPGVVRATAPVPEMVQALKDAGVAARASSDAGDYVGNLTFYRLIVELGAEPNPRPVGCLAIPAGCDVERATRAVKAAASSFAGYLSSVRAALLSA